MQPEVARSDLLEAYVRRGVDAVDGWLAKDTVGHVLRLHDLQESLGIRGGVGEIGVHHGKFFILLYLLTRGDERSVALDLFEQQELNTDRSGRGDRAVFERNLARHAGGDERVTILAGDSTRVDGRALRAAAKGPLRLLSIDGGHLARIVRHDLQTARDALVDGGVVVLDDYSNPEFPGVSEGTAAFFLSGQNAELVPFLLAANKLYLTTVRYADAYLDRIARADIGTPLAGLARFQFLEGPTSPIIPTELFGRTVLAYSPDRYSLTHRFGADLRRARRRLRLSLGAELSARFPNDSPLGRALRRVANAVLPY